MTTYLFGYGTLINNESRQATLVLCFGSGTSALQQAQDFPAFLVEISPEFGYRREFCFKSGTGFTALGLVPTGDSGYSRGPNLQGVVFGVSATALSEFDRREKGYTRVKIPLEYILALSSSAAAAPHPLPAGAVVYTYVQLDEHKALPSEDHPILQTYIDTCLSGCLAWGGEKLMSDFVAATGGWSTYWLNDPPMSRRPWLHRPKCWEAIDAALASHAACTHFEHRKHAEEYVRSHHQQQQRRALPEAALALRGMWGCPLRDASFVGR